MKNVIYQVVSDFTHYEALDTFEEAENVAKKLLKENEYDNVYVVKLTETPFESGDFEEDIVWTNDQTILQNISMEKNND